MPILTIYRALRTIALSEFADVVVHARIIFLPINNDPEDAVREVLTFVRNKLLGRS